MAMTKYLVPTGHWDDGTVCFTEDDIKTTKMLNGVPKDTYSIAKLPISNILFRSMPRPTSSGTEYKGNPTPIQVFVNSANQRCYRCRHVMREEDEKKGTPRKICTATWIASNSVNV